MRRTYPLTLSPGVYGPSAGPDYGTRRKIEKQVAKSAHEHIIVYADAARTIQTWQWVKREPDKPNCCREHWSKRRGVSLAVALGTKACALDFTAVSQ